MNLSAQEGSLFKETLLCRTGVWDGMYGPVTVTKEKLDLIADKYNKQRAQPLNENDYAPLIKNHDRDVDNTLGRVLAPLSVRPLKDPETGIEGFGLYGTLRVDDDQAKLNVQKGKYAQVSISFDDESTYELFETSFVAVEAARRSMVLSQGEKTMNLEQVQKQLADLSAKHDGFVGKAKALAKKRKELGASLVQALSASQAEVSEGEKAVAALKLQITAAALSASFKSFVRQGRMTKAELAALKVEELAAMPKSAIEAVLGSYRNRQPSTDVLQHGQTDAKPVDFGKLGPKQMRELMAAQKKGLSSLAADEKPGNGEDKDPKDKDAAAKKLGDSEKDKEAGEHDVKFEEVDKVLKSLEESVMPFFDKAKEHMKRLSEISKKLSEEEDKEGDAA